MYKFYKTQNQILLHEITFEMSGAYLNISKLDYQEKIFFSCLY